MKIFEADGVVVGTPCRYRSGGRKIERFWRYRSLGLLLKLLQHRMSNVHVRSFAMAKHSRPTPSLFPRHCDTRKLKFYGNITNDCTYCVLFGWQGPTLEIPSLDRIRFLDRTFHSMHSFEGEQATSFFLTVIHNN